jgi:hypothetical protein
MVRGGIDVSDVLDNLPMETRAPPRQAREQEPGNEIKDQAEENDD